MLFNAGDWLYLKILRRQKRHGGEKEKERKSGARKSENGHEDIQLIQRWESHFISKIDVEGKKEFKKKKGRMEKRKTKKTTERKNERMKERKKERSEARQK